MSEPEQKKPLEALIAEHHEARPFWNKRFKHIKSGNNYELLMTAHDEGTQELMAVYCLSALTQLKFVRPYKTFMEKFEVIKN